MFLVSRRIRACYASFDREDDSTLYRKELLGEACKMQNAAIVLVSRQKQETDLQTDWPTGRVNSDKKTGLSSGFDPIELKLSSVSDSYQSRKQEIELTVQII